MDDLKKTVMNLERRLSSIEDMVKNLRGSPLVTGYNGKTLVLNDNLNVIDLLRRIVAMEAIDHDRLHGITSTDDHTSSATPGAILKADENGLPVEATASDVEGSHTHSKIVASDGSPDALTADAAGNLTAASAFENPKMKITAEGGLAVKLTNKTGSASIKGYCVSSGDAVNNSVVLVPINDPDCIGVFYEDGIADGSEAWVVVSGIADVYFWGGATGGNPTRGELARTGLTADTGEISGQAYSEPIPTSPFSVDKHFCEIGHVLESRTGAGLAKCVLHFN